MRRVNATGKEQEQWEMSSGNKERKVIMGEEVIAPKRNRVNVSPWRQKTSSSNEEVHIFVFFT